MSLKNKVFLFLSAGLFFTGLPVFSSVSGSAKCRKSFTLTMEDYTQIVERYYEGDMQKTYRGSTKNFQEEGRRILDEEGKIREEYKGMEGYVRFAERYYEGDMSKAYKNMSVVLRTRQMRSLGWQQSYWGSTAEFREGLKKILDKEGKIKDEYKGMEGYALFADKYYEGDMFKAYKDISTVLKTRQMRNLDWRQSYWGSTKDFQEDKSRILGKRGGAKNEYKGMEGYALFADRYYEGDMLKAYFNISAVLGGFRQIRGLGLGWQKYEGRTEQFRKD